MKIKKGKVSKTWHVVFEDQYAADKWRWLFWSILRRTRCCFGQYDNAYNVRNLRYE